MNSPLHSLCSARWRRLAAPPTCRCYPKLCGSQMAQSCSPSIHTSSDCRKLLHGCKQPFSAAFVVQKIPEFLFILDSLLYPKCVRQMAQTCSPSATTVSPCYYPISADDAILQPLSSCFIGSSHRAQVSKGLGFTLSQLGQARRGSWCEVGVKQDTGLQGFRVASLNSVCEA